MNIQQLQLTELFKLAATRRNRVSDIVPKYFNVEVTSNTAPFTYGFTPYLNNTSIIVNWDDGVIEQFSGTSSTEKTHTWDTPGTKLIQIVGNSNIHRVRISPVTVSQQLLVTNVYGNWTALGDITDGTEMFDGLKNATMSFSTLPDNLQTSYRMFNNCNAAVLTISEWPTTFNGNCASMFNSCYNSLLGFTNIPYNATVVDSIFMYANKINPPISSLATNSSTKVYTNMFRGCILLYLNLDTITDDLSHVTTIQRMFAYCSHVTGDASAFLARCAPGCTYLEAFLSTGCTNIPA